MKAIGEILSLAIHVVGFLAIIGIIGSVWLILLLLVNGLLTLAIIFLAGLGAAIAHNKGRGFLEWLCLGTLFPIIGLIAAIAIRRPPVVVCVSPAEAQPLPVALTVPRRK